MRHPTPPPLPHWAHPPRLHTQFCQFLIFVTLFLMYLGFAIYYNDSNWTTREVSGWG